MSQSEIGVQQFAVVQQNSLHRYSLVLIWTEGAGRSKIAAGKAIACNLACKDVVTLLRCAPGICPNALDQCY